MGSGEERSATKPPAPAQPVYRSRQAILRQRIASTEAELRELRAELCGLQEVRVHRTRRVLGVLAAVVAATAAFLQVHRPDPFTFRPLLHNAGWTLSFQFDRPIRCIDVIVEAPGGGRDKVGCVTLSSSRHMAEAALTLDQARTPSTLTVEYEVGGLGGGLRQVTAAFDPMASQIAEVREVMNVGGQWVQGKDVAGRRLLSFTHLLSYAGVLDEIRYGFDDGPLDRTVPFGRPTELGALSHDELYREIPASARSVTIQLTFVDGTTMIRRVPVHDGGSADSAGSAPKPPVMPHRDEN
jgi:hypothetical protein